MASFPQVSCDPERLHRVLRPPCQFVSPHVQLAVMDAAERHRELVTDLASERGGLGKPKMMRIGGLSPAHEACLRCDERPMILIAFAPRSTEREISTVGSRNRHARVRGD